MLTSRNSLQILILHVNTIMHVQDSQCNKDGIFVMSRFNRATTFTIDNIKQILSSSHPIYIFVKHFDNEGQLHMCHGSHYSPLQSSHNFHHSALCGDHVCVVSICLPHGPGNYKDDIQYVHTHGEKVENNCKMRNENTV